MRSAAWTFLIVVGLLEAGWVRAVGVPMPAGASAQAKRCIARINRTVQGNLFSVERSLFDYFAYLGPRFKRRFEALKAGQHWIDIGAGNGLALRQGSWKKRNLRKKPVRLTAVNAAEPDFADGLAKWAAEDPVNRKNLIHFFESDGVDFNKLGQADLMTDVMGAMSYTWNMSEYLRKVGEGLASDGALLAYVRVPKIFDAAGNEVPFLTWFRKNVKGMKVKVLADNVAGSPEVFVLEISRTKAKNVVVPQLKYEGGSHGTPPGRVFSAK